MRVGTNSTVRGALDIYLDGGRLRNPFYADDVFGEVWVAIEPFQISAYRSLPEWNMPIGSYTHDGLGVVRLVGKVEITITPYGGLTRKQVEQAIKEEHDQQKIKLQRVAVAKWIDLIWPTCRESELARYEQVL